MASLKSIIIKYFTSNKMVWWMFLLVILLILATLYAYYFFYLPQEKNKKFKDLPNTSGGDSNTFNSGKSVKIYFFHVDWCPYCTKATPEWDIFSKKYHNREINGYIIQCESIDCTDVKGVPSIKTNYIEKYDIKGYPTVKMEKDGKVIDFDAKVTSSSLAQFVDNVVDKK